MCIRDRANNDYEQLEKFIAAQPDADINGYITRKRGGLLNVAIQSKSKECFDLIISHPNFTVISTKPEYKFDYWDDSCYDIYDEYDNPGTILIVNNKPNNEPNQQDQGQVNPNLAPKVPRNRDDDSDDSDEDNNELAMTPERYANIIGTDEAIQTYTRAPNFANGHYLRQLIQAKASFTPENLTTLEKYPEIYNQICAHTEFTHDYLLEILRYQICSKSPMAPNTFAKVMDNLTPEHLSWFAKLSVKRSNFNFLSYLFETYGSQIQLLEYGKPTDILTYALILLDRKEMFKVMEAIISQYIKDPIGNQFDAYMFVQHFIECEYFVEMAKILPLWSQLKFPVDLGPYVRSFVKYTYHTYWDQYHTDFEYSISRFSNLYLLLKSSWCKTNPWDFTDNTIIKEEINKKLTIRYRHATASNAHMLKKTFENFAHVFIANGFEPTPNAKEAMEILGVNYGKLVASTPKWIKDNIGELYQINTTKQTKVAKKTQDKKTKFVEKPIVIDL
jgi:hypothetical protein